MSLDNEYWMNYSIDISNNTSQSTLKVGIVLTSKQNKLLCSAFTGEQSNKLWYSIIVDKIEKLKIFNVHNIYLAINTLSTIDSFDLSKLPN